MTTKSIAKTGSHLFAGCSFALLVAAGGGAALVSAGSASAEPRGGGGGYFGCTIKQIQHYSGCVDLGDQQIVNGSSTIYRVVCSPDGTVSCCEVDQNDNVVGGSCVVLSGRPRPGQGIVAPSAGLSPSGIYTPPPHRGPVTPRPPHGGAKNPGGGTPPSGHRHPVRIKGFKPPSGVKTTGGNSAPVTIGRHADHPSGGGHR